MFFSRRFRVAKPPRVAKVERMNLTSENVQVRRGHIGINRKAFSVRETAIALGISRTSVRRLIQRGLLRPNRALRHLLIPATEIDRFLQ
jgi:excisionase family DNA binding protein